MQFRTRQTRNIIVNTEQGLKLADSAYEANGVAVFETVGLPVCHHSLYYFDSSTLFLP